MHQKSSQSLAIDDSEEVEITAQVAAVQVTMDHNLRDDVLAECCKKQVLEDEAGNSSIHTGLGESAGHVPSGHP